MDRLTSMAVFVRAAELGSFSAAARALGLSPQMVGKHVGFLEERLGAVLLRRSTRRQSLTEIGQLFVERCRRTLAEAEMAEAVSAAFTDTPRGRLRVTAPVTFGAVALLPVVTRFLARHPEVSIELDLTDRYVDLVGEGYDVAIRLGALPDSALQVRALSPYRLIVCAAPAYLAVRGTPRTPDDLAAHDCLGFLYASGQTQGPWRLGDRAIDVPCRLHVNDARALHAAALAGEGVLMQADLLLSDDIAAGRLVRLLDDHATPVRPLHVVFPAARPAMPALRAFIDAVAAAFPP